MWHFSPDELPKWNSSLLDIVYHFVGHIYHVSYVYHYVGQVYHVSYVFHYVGLISCYVGHTCRDISHVNCNVGHVCHYVGDISCYVGHVDDYVFDAPRSRAQRFSVSSRRPSVSAQRLWSSPSSRPLSSVTQNKTSVREISVKPHVCGTREGNVFTRVCDSVCERREGRVCPVRLGGGGG